MKLSNAQISKIISSGGFLGKTLGNLGKKALLDFAVPLTKDVLLKLANKATSFVLDKFERKIAGQGALRAGRGFPLSVSNKVESREQSGLLVGAGETVKHEKKKKKKGWISSCYDGIYGSFTDTTQLITSY